jgi:hypothetical protein
MLDIYSDSVVHGFQERFYFGDNVLPCFESGIPLLKRRLYQLPDFNNVGVSFPRTVIFCLYNECSE